MPICVYGCGKEYVPLPRGKQTARGHGTCYRESMRRASDEHRRLREESQLRSLTEPSGGYAKSATRREPHHEHPKGWEPHVEEFGNTATAISQPSENGSPDETELIRGWNLDPKQWRIVGPVNCRRWQTLRATTTKNEGGDPIVTKETIWLYYFRANLERVEPIRESEIASIIEEIRTHVPIPIAPPQGDDAFIVCIADSQMGKPDGDGTRGTAERFLLAIDSVEERIAELRQLGRPLGALYIFGMGDLIENCDGHYAQQTFRVELNLRDQVNVMRRLIFKAIERWAPLFSKVVVAAVGGNHGEVRKDGKSFTDFADNFDVAIFDSLADTFAMNEAAYGHVSFRIPKDDLSLTFDIAGKIVGITHGHVAGKGQSGNVPKKMNDWWAKQAHGRQPIGDAEILITAHYHHLAIQETGVKAWIQCPAMEGTSDWWRNQSGQDSRPGLLTLRISPSGWSDLQVV